MMPARIRHRRFFARLCRGLAFCVALLELRGYRLGGVEGLNEGCSKATNRVTVSFRALGTEDFLPGDVCCFACPGLGEGVGVLPPALLGYG